MARVSEQAIENGREYSRQYYHRHREEILAHKKANPPHYTEETRARGREYYTRDLEKKRRQARESHARCRDKRWATRLLKEYGVSAEQYNTILETQGGVCAICGAAPHGKRKRLAVDHDHNTGRVRGLICGRCNVAIGMSGDSPETLRAAAAYIERSYGGN